MKYCIVVLAFILFLPVAYAQQGKSEAAFQAVFGIPSNDPNARLVVHTYLNYYLQPQACHAVMTFEKSPNNEISRAWTDASIRRLRQAVTIAEDQGVVVGEGSAAKDFLRMYDDAKKDVGVMLSCS